MTIIRNGRPIEVPLGERHLYGASIANDRGAARRVAVP